MSSPAEATVDEKRIFAADSQRFPGSCALPPGVFSKAHPGSSEKKAEIYRKTCFFVQGCTRGRHKQNRPQTEPVAKSSCGTKRANQEASRNVRPGILPTRSAQSPCINAKPVPQLGFAATSNTDSENQPLQREAVRAAPRASRGGNGRSTTPRASHGETSGDSTSGATRENERRAGRRPDAPPDHQRNRPKTPRRDTPRRCTPIPKVPRRLAPRHPYRAVRSANFRGTMLASTSGASST